MDFKHRNLTNFCMTQVSSPHVLSIQPILTLNTSAFENKKKADDNNILLALQVTLTVNKNFFLQ